MTSCFCLRKTIGNLKSLTGKNKFNLQRYKPVEGKGNGMGTLKRNRKPQESEQQARSPGCCRDVDDLGQVSTFAVLTFYLDCLRYSDCNLFPAETVIADSHGATQERS